MTTRSKRGRSSFLMLRRGYAPASRVRPARFSTADRPRARGLSLTSPTWAARRSARCSIAARASAPTSSSSRNRISPPAACAQPPTTRPSHQTVGDALPLRSNSSGPCSARYQSRSLPAHRRRVERGEQRGPGLDGFAGLGVIRQHEPRRTVEIDLGGFDALPAPRASRRASSPPTSAGPRRVAGPKAASQRRASSARAAAGSRVRAHCGLPALERAPSGTGSTSTSRAGGCGSRVPRRRAPSGRG